jgi:D-methionine transport system substrate-binding protein
MKMKTTNRTNLTAQRPSWAAGLLALWIGLALALSSCTGAPTPPAQAPAPAASEAPEALIHLKVGASPVPHADILHFVQENLAQKAGLEIDVIEFTDYVQPNLALADGQIDANFFQHLPYLEDFNQAHKLALVSAAAVHIEPLGIYSRKVTSLDEIPERGVVAIPNDATNAGRALHLLAENGLITLKEGTGYSATPSDITANPKNLKIVELEAAQLARSLDDTVVSVINGNYALQAGLTPSKDALALESGENNPYANILAVRKDSATQEGIEALAALLTSPEVSQFIQQAYQGSVIPVK